MTTSAPCPDCGVDGMTWGATHSEECPRVGTPAQFGPPWRDLVVEESKGSA